MLTTPKLSCRQNVRLKVVADWLSGAALCWAFSEKPTRVLGKDKRHTVSGSRPESA